MHTNLAFVFPGQGSQSVGMLADLAGQSPIVRATFDEAGQGCGLDLWTLSQQGPEDELNRTEVTQPALLAAGVAVWRVWNERGGAQPSAFAGHSLGEYAALVAAGALSLADGAALVRERGRLMQAAVPTGVGAMAAILMADDAVIVQACLDAAGDQVVAPANFNSPGQTVIAGHAEAVDRAIALLAERGVKKAVKLAVSVPSHSALMKPAADALRAKMDALSWTMPDRPVIQNADAFAHDSLEAIKDALVRQVFGPVRWTGCVQALIALGVTRVGECGPGKVLTGLCKRIDKSLDGRALATDLDAAKNDWI